MKSPILESVKSGIRNPYAWPGGYPVYTVMADGELMCCDCARKDYRQIVSDTREYFKGQRNTGYAALGAEVYWEGPTMFCCGCNKPLESAYGDPDGEE